MITIVIGEMRASVPSQTNPWEFDAVAFARALVAGRQRHGFSTRELSRRAGISQPYVVALERAATDPAAATPTPTVDVMARLADALGHTPRSLLDLAVRRKGRHVLLVLEDDTRSPLTQVNRACGHDHLRWIWAASSPGEPRPRAAAHHIDLRRSRARAYDPHAIARSLEHELAELGDALQGEQLGLVFAETSAVMAGLDDPGVIIRFEHAWHDVVTSATDGVGAHTVWNVCVYELEALVGLGNPVDATLDLIRSHDAMWLGRRDTVLSGGDAARRALQHMRPHHVGRADWSQEVDALVAGLDLAA